MSDYIDDGYEDKGDPKMNPLTQRPYSRNYYKLKDGVAPDYFGWGKFSSQVNKQAFLDKIEKSNIIILTGETGSGKTTQIPKILYEYLDYGETVLCTQPRRVTTSLIAKRVAEEMDVKLGTFVGFRYQGSLEETGGDIYGLNKLYYMTDGTFASFILPNPSALADYGAVIIDEAHVRNEAIDTLLYLIREVLRKIPMAQTKFIIMSATVDKEIFMNYYKKEGILHHHLSGATQFPIKDVYLNRSIYEGVKMPLMHVPWHLKRIIGDIYGIQWRKPKPDRRDRKDFRPHRDRRDQKNRRDWKKDSRPRRDRQDRQEFQRRDKPRDFQRRDKPRDFQRRDKPRDFQRRDKQRDFQRRDNKQRDFQRRDNKQRDFQRRDNKQRDFQRRDKPRDFQRRDNKQRDFQPRDKQRPRDFRDFGEKPKEDDKNIAEKVEELEETMEQQAGGEGLEDLEDLEDMNEEHEEMEDKAYDDDESSSSESSTSDDETMDEEFQMGGASEEISPKGTKLRVPEGDILVFLPTIRALSDFARVIGAFLDEHGVKNYKTMAVSGRSTEKEKNQAQKAIPGITKIVFATDVAETGITIENLSYVIDTGIKNQVEYDVKERATRAGIEFTSQAAVRQRRGRTGRRQPGTCYHLYMEEELKKQFASHPKPNILTNPVSTLVMQLLFETRGEKSGITMVRKMIRNFLTPIPKPILDAYFAHFKNRKWLSAQTGHMTELGECIFASGFRNRLDLAHVYLLFDAYVLEPPVLADLVMMMEISNRADMKEWVKPGKEGLPEEFKAKYMNKYGDLMGLYHVYLDYQGRKLPRKYHEFLNIEKMKELYEASNDLLLNPITDNMICYDDRKAKYKVIEDDIYRNYVNAFRQGYAENVIDGSELKFNPRYDVTMIEGGVDPNKKYFYLEKSIRTQFGKEIRRNYSMLFPIEEKEKKKSKKEKDV